ERLFAMLLRVDWPSDQEPIPELRRRMAEIGRLKGLTIRTWSRDEHDRPPRIAICTTYRHETPRAVLSAVRDGHLRATPAVMIGNRNACLPLAEEFGVPFMNVGDANGRADERRIVELCDEHD